MVALGAFHFHSQVHQNYFAVLEVSHRHVQPLFLNGVKPKSQIYLIMVVNVMWLDAD